MAQGYGVDTWCTDSLVTGRLDSGVSLVAHALYRRFITERGTLVGGLEESVYGLDLAGFVGTTTTERALSTLPGMMRAEALKDDRVRECLVTVSTSTDAEGSVSIVARLAVTLVDSGESFALTLGVSAVTTSILGLERIAA